jgi:hypothetical protein
MAREIAKPSEVLSQSEKGKLKGREPAWNI